METQLGAKNQKKISNGQGCRTGTHAQTHGRAHEREFIGSFRSLKISGEPKMKNELTKIKKTHSKAF